MRARILQFVQGFHVGGTERQAVQLARLLHETERYQIYVGCHDGSGILRKELACLQLPEIPEYPLRSFYDANTFAQLRRFVRLLRDWQIEVIHTYDFYTNIFGMVGAAMARVPVRIASRRESAFRPSTHRMVERTAYRLAQAVVANSEEVRRQLVAEGVRADKIVTVYNGVEMCRVAIDASVRREEMAARFGLPLCNGQRFVAIVANLHARKDHATFLRAAARVHALAPTTAFLIAGEGELHQALRTLAGQLGLQEHTFFLGRCQNVAELLAISDVCVLSSRSGEGFSNALLEYMAAARPVVATDVGGAREAVIESETGYVVRVGDHEAMAARIVSLLNDPLTARNMGIRGQSVVRERFSSAAQVRNIMQLYDQLLLTSGQRRVARGCRADG